MNRKPPYTYERFIYETFEQFRWINRGDITFDEMAKRIREEYPKRKFTRAEFLQRKHLFDKGGV